MDYNGKPKHLLMKSTSYNVNADGEEIDEDGSVVSNKAFSIGEVVVENTTLTPSTLEQVN